MTSTRYYGADWTLYRSLDSVRPEHLYIPPVMLPPLVGINSGRTSWQDVPRDDTRRIKLVSAEGKRGDADAVSGIRNRFRDVTSIAMYHRAGFRHLALGVMGKGNVFTDKIMAFPIEIQFS